MGGGKGAVPIWRGALSAGAWQRVGGGWTEGSGRAMGRKQAPWAPFEGEWARPASLGSPPGYLFPSLLGAFHFPPCISPASVASHSSFVSLLCFLLGSELTRLSSDLWFLLRVIRSLLLRPFPRVWVFSGLLPSLYSTSPPPLACSLLFVCCVFCLPGARFDLVALPP